MQSQQTKKHLLTLLMLALAVVCFWFWLNGSSCEGIAYADTVPSEKYIPVADSVNDAMAMIDFFIRKVPRHPLAKLKTKTNFARWQIEANEKTKTPLSLTMAIMFRESSGKAGRVGPGGELGPMQVHPDTARKFNCDMSTIKGQILCGQKILRSGFDKCNNWKKAVYYYASRKETCKAKKGSRLEWVGDDRIGFAIKLERIARPTSTVLQQASKQQSLDHQRQSLFQPLPQRAWL